MLWKYGAVSLMPCSPATSNFCQSSNGDGTTAHVPVNKARPGIGAGPADVTRHPFHGSVVQRTPHASWHSEQPRRARREREEWIRGWTRTLLKMSCIPDDARKRRGRLPGPAVADAAGAREDFLPLRLERRQRRIGIGSGDVPARTASDSARTRLLLKSTRWNELRSSRMPAGIGFIVSACVTKRAVCLLLQRAEPSVQLIAAGRVRSAEPRVLVRRRPSARRC